ncbi:MAG: heparan-alpha-glucosaminide N-acetyltransferase domain-containing protein, partial [Tannerella sp.]|nr:heparan-alpha-glucosaminide N-acetyltransferase domain-containing protein [Tannerella sp.]
MKNTKTIRIAALDVFRAITMFLMLFVNDIPGLKNIPHGLLHAAADEDMLGFSDIIFPAFLFAMGMAIPYAIDARY